MTKRREVNKSIQMYYSRSYFVLVILQNISNIYLFVMREENKNITETQHQPYTLMSSNYEIFKINTAMVYRKVPNVSLPP